MGAGGKMEASKVKVADINTVNCFSKNNTQAFERSKIDKLKVVFHLKFKMILV
jgi:hypothetical protein